jgi:hypothetical protein
MPTNRLWLEHTERAAWDSVQALREKLSAAEERLQRFVPVKETWHSIVEALDRARNDLKIEKERYSDIAHALVDELRDMRVARDQLIADLETARNVSAASVASTGGRTTSAALDAVAEDATSEKTAAAARAILEQYETDSGALTGRRKLTLTRKALERHLEELEELDDGSPSQLLDQAARIGALALRLIVLSRAEMEKRAAASNDEDDE